MGAEAAAALAKGTVPGWVAVEDKGNAVGGVGIVAYQQVERQVEVMGQVDALVAPVIGSRISAQQKSSVASASVEVRWIPVRGSQISKILCMPCMPAWSVPNVNTRPSGSSAACMPMIGQG